MTARSYLSIGQVLELLKQEFPDLTISKIRFLESQGLLDPERTPSGYRKFYDPDVDRLRFILRAQHEQYLPLKVIKGRLGSDDEANADENAEDLADDDADVGVPARSAGAAGNGRAADDDLGASRHPSVAAGGARPSAAGRVPAARAGGATLTPAPSAATAVPLAGLRAVPPTPGTAEAEDGADEEPTSLTIEELAAAVGLATADVSELERFGLLTGRRIAGTTYYDADCAAIAAVAARFRAFGVEARHLRMYRTAVEREAGFFEQVVTPMLKQRNPQARRQAVETLIEMSQLGSTMREAVLRQALREYTGGA